MLCPTQCDVGYLCANFSLPSLSVLDLVPMYATDRQTDVRRASSLNASAMREHNNNSTNNKQTFQHTQLTGNMATYRKNGAS